MRRALRSGDAGLPAGVTAFTRCARQAEVGSYACLARRGGSGATPASARAFAVDSDPPLVSECVQDESNGREADPRHSTLDVAAARRSVRSPRAGVTPAESGRGTAAHVRGRCRRAHDAAEPTVATARHSGICMRRPIRSSTRPLSASAGFWWPRSPTEWSRSRQPAQPHARAETLTLCIRSGTVSRQPSRPPPAPRGRQGGLPVSSRDAASGARQPFWPREAGLVASARMMLARRATEVPALSLSTLVPG